MTLCAADYEPALAVLVARHQARVFGFAARFLGQRELADEATQETFLTVWTLRSRYQASGRFVPYLMRVCLNTCRTVSRGRWRRRRAMERLENEPNPKGPDAEQALLRDECERQLERAVAQLPGRLRDAVLLRFYSGLSYAEMVPILGRGEIALRARVFKAVERLRATLSERAFDELSK
jgi:RNA polymerase sigma-70 factor (ECF subfamily)